MTQPPEAGLMRTVLDDDQPITFVSQTREDNEFLNPRYRVGTAHFRNDDERCVVIDRLFFDGAESHIGIAARIGDGHLQDEIELWMEGRPVDPEAVRRLAMAIMEKLGQANLLPTSKSETIPCLVDAGPCSPEMARAVGDLATPNVFSLVSAANGEEPLQLALAA